MNRSNSHGTLLGALVASAVLYIAEASGAATPSDGSEGAAGPGIGSAARPSTGQTLQQRAVDMRRRAFEATVRDGQTVITQAVGGECHAIASQRVDRYRDVLDSANAVAARAEAALPANPGKAATLYVQAEKIARGVVSSGAAVGCMAARH